MTEQQPLEEMSGAELREEVRRLRGELQAERSGVSRRQVVASAAAAAGLGVLGVYSSDVVSAAPTGTFPEPTDDPLLRLRADRIRFIPRSSDPSSPAGGTRWVVE